MSNINKNGKITLKELSWDTQFFGVKSAKAVLYEPLENTEWLIVQDYFSKYQFISIENRNSEPVNARFIGKDTNAFLADVNIQFVKPLSGNKDTDKGIFIGNNLEYTEKLLRIGRYEYSKFLEDPELAKRNGTAVYTHWLVNSFNRQDKYFALSKDENGAINGYILYSFDNESCMIELIAVDSAKKNKGIGTKLFNAVENTAYNNGCKEIKVGTQIRNLGAINFYNKMGCRQTGCHQVYHLWNN